jgi:hypothetical protein
MPQRKTKCRACGQFMYVRSTPDDRTRRLMTEAQMQAAEAAWEGYGARQMAQLEMQDFGALAVDYVLPPAPIDVSAAVAKADHLAQGKGPMKQVCIGLFRSAESPTDAFAALLALTAIDLAQARAMGARTVQLRVPPPGGCARCKPLHNTVVPSDSPAVAVVPVDCPRLMAPSGRSRAMCEVMISAWIRGPDGKIKVDRLPLRSPPAPAAISAENLEEARQAWSNVLGVELPKAEPAAAPMPWWRRIFGNR